MHDSEKTGVVFNIQNFSVHDGAGIRTLVFLKGCPLRCLWCSNPESQRAEPERAYNPTRCLGAQSCGRCVTACPNGALAARDGLIQDNRPRCTGSFACVRACPSGARTLYGQMLSVNTVLRKVEDDSPFYARSGGGMTISGGEPMAQPEFTLALLREARARHIHTTMETSGHCPAGLLDEACGLLCAIIYDIKCGSSEKHKRFTGVGNERIIKNFHHICAAHPNLPLLVRTPVIPGFNDTEEDILDIWKIISVKPNIEYELLPYHRMGQPKYGYLGREYPMKQAALDEAKMNRLNSLIAGQR